MSLRTLRALHVTDPHLHARAGARLRGVDTHASLAAVLEHAFSADTAPDFILATGDIAQDDSRAAYQHFREIVGRTGLPVYCLPGNHDVPDLMATVLRAAPFQVGGVADHSPWSIVSLDSTAPGDAGGNISAAELRRLDDILASRADAHCLVALHHQPVPMGSRWLDSVGLRNAPDFLTVIDRHANVRGIVWGHVHQAFDRNRDGVRLLSTPSTCAQFLPGAEQFTVDTRPPGYRWLDLHPDGTIGTSVVWME